MGPSESAASATEPPETPLRRSRSDFAVPGIILFVHGEDLRVSLGALKTEKKSVPSSLFEDNKQIEDKKNKNKMLEVFYLDHAI